MKDTDWEILYELYKNPNLTKVAQVLYISQPSLTKRLQHIEEEFQVEVVKRTAKGLVFTKKGEYLAKQAEIYLQFMKETKDTLSDPMKFDDDKITIGGAYTYVKYTLSDVLLPYTKMHPEVQFDIVNGFSDELLRKMLEESIDVAFVRGDFNGAVNRTLISRNQACLISKKPLELDELPNLLRIDYRLNEKVRGLLDSWWEDQFGTTKPAKMTVGYLDFACQLVEKGFGYTYGFLPENFDNKYNLCITPLTKKDGTKVIRNTWFLYPQNKRLSENLQHFIEYIEKMEKQTEIE